MKNHTNIELVLDDVIEKHNILNAIELSNSQALGFSFDDEYYFNEQIKLHQSLDKYNSIEIPKNRITDYTNVSCAIINRANLTPSGLATLADDYYDFIIGSLDVLYDFIVSEEKKHNDSNDCFDFLELSCAAELDHASMICNLLESGLIRFGVSDDISFDKDNRQLKLNVGLATGLRAHNLTLHSLAFTTWINELRTRFWVDGKVSISNY